MPSNETTTVTCITDDQGGGGVSCDTCGYFGYFKYLSKGDRCPKCDRLVTNYPIIEPYPYGGSDF